MSSYHSNNNNFDINLNNEEVVISGISGIFPKSDNVKEFMKNLYDKVDMVTSDDTNCSLDDLDRPRHAGKISNINRFDAQFFKISFQLACRVEPMSRKLLEHAYAAIFDSGTNPLELQGKKVGVFVGSAYTDVSTYNMYEVNKRSKFIVNGGSKSMLANRISYWLDGVGPSYMVDHADAGSIACLELAYKSMKAGECDAAIVGGSNLCVFPGLTVNIQKTGLLCSDGKTKCFDKNADGYVRSDAVGLVFLQKAKHAKRIYAEVCYVKGIYGLKDDAKFLPTRNANDIEIFLKEFYSETDVDPKDVEYIEAQGTALPEADRNEMIAIGEVFGTDKAVKIGCVKSNMGCSESASGICALTKLCLSYHTGQIPANLFYSEPHDITAIQENKLKILTDNTSFNRGYSALNNFSFTGANFHVLLKGRYKQKNMQKYKVNIPRLVLASGRKEDCVNAIFENLKTNSVDPEQIGLLHNIYNIDIPGHTGRGYAVLETNEMKETVLLGQKMDYYPGTKRPLWFVYSGMGSQWLAMGADLMKISIFADAIHKCNAVLKPLGIDLIYVLTSKEKTVFDNSLHAFVGIGAVQVGLTDILKEMGVVPENIIGHSLGEIACGYEDGCVSREEVMLITYNRGVACQNAKFEPGLMAAVGLGYKEIIKKCPPEIDVACHNSSTSVTLSGPLEAMQKFLEKLRAQGIFAKDVQSGNIAYHSRYIEKCGPELMKRLKEVIPNPKPRSKRWISTSVPHDKWDDPLAKLSSAEYYTNNLLNAVLFEEAATMIPDNAIVVEIAPHGLLQAILKRSHKSCTHIPLTKRGCTDGVTFFLEAVGNLYINGLNPKVDILYPKIEYPVSTETPMLSHFVEWEHSEEWPTYNYETTEKITAQARNVIMSVNDDDYSYLQGHIIEGQNILPEAALLVIVWETLSMYRETNYRDQSVIFKDITFHSQVHVIKEKPLKLYVLITRGNNTFEIVQDDQIIASGVVSGAKVLKLQHDVEDVESDIDEITLTADDVYRILDLRGYNYRDQFKSIISSNLSCNKVQVKWTSNWVTFLDSLIQLNNLVRHHSGISVPKFIRKLKISVFEHEVAKPINVDGVKCYNAEYNYVYDVVRCAGVEIENIVYDDKTVIESIPDAIEKKSFYSFYTMESVDVEFALKIYFQIIAENIVTNQLRVIPFLTVQGYEIYDMIQKFCDNNSLIDAEVNIRIEKEISNQLLSENNKDETNIVIIENLLANEMKIFNLQRSLMQGEFVIAIEQTVPKTDSYIRDYFTILSSMSNGKQILVLLKKTELSFEVVYFPIKFDNNFLWLNRVYGELKTTKRVVLISERQPFCGLIGFVKKLRKTGCSKLSLIVIDDFHAPKFNPDSDVYSGQLQKNLAINVFKKGEWGGYYFTKSRKMITTRNAILTSLKPGDVDSLNWIETPAVPPTNNFVQVYFAGLSLRDSQNASDMSSNENNYGMDYSGIDNDGERVMGVLANGSLRSTVECDPYLIWPVPEHWSMEDAATVPLPYLQAYYCLVIRGQLKRNQSILITGGAGALGQAAIALCLALGCTVYATVSNMDKKKFLQRLFPEFNENNIGYLHDDAFLRMIKMNSPIDGCDYVINNTSGFSRQFAMKYVGFMGCFMDLNFYDAKNNIDIGMDFLNCIRSYKAVDIANIFKPENVEDKKILQIVISEGIQKGIVRPLSRIVYSPKDVITAFRHLSSNKRKGRIVVRMRDAVIIKQGFSVTPRLNCTSSGVHIVVCDKEGLGVELADRLVKRGVNNIVLNMKQSLVTGYVHTKFELWMKNDVRIKLSTELLYKDKACTKLLMDISKMGPIVGVYIVQESEKEKKEEGTSDEFIEAVNKFGMVVNNLDIFTRHHKVSYFVVILNKSQNDSERYSSSLAERICQTRSEIGLPALIIHNINENMETAMPENRLYAKALSRLFNTMEIGIKQNHNNIRSFNVKENSDNFMERVARILGIVKGKQIDENTEIRNLNVDETILEQLKNLIKYTYNIDYTVKKIQSMAIGSFKKIGDNLENTNTKFNSGLGAFYGVIDSEYDHVEESRPVILMRTLLNNITETVLDPNTTYLTMIPGFEGRCEIFNSVAERLKIQAVSIQLGPDLYEPSSVKQLAHNVRKYMKSKFITQSKFYLLGYSFGVNIALEVASILESEGHVGVVYCLDSSPEVLISQLRAYVGDIDEHKLENEIVEHIYSLIAGCRSKAMSEELLNLDTFDEKGEIFSEKLKGIVTFSKEYKRCVLETAYRRIKMALDYKPTLKLDSEVILIKGIPHTNVVSLSDDYGLGKYTKKPVKVFNIESDHAMAPYDSRVSNIINKMLDESLLNEFKKKNLCDVYLGEVF